MKTLVRFVRGFAVALGTIAVFAVCDDPIAPPDQLPVMQRPRLSATLGASATLVAAGDIAVCNTTSSSTRNDDATADLVRAIPDAAVATLGDHSFVSSSGFITAADYTNCYGPSWGATADILPRTHPTPGDKDWNAPAGSTPGNVYFDYFNGAGVSDGPAGARGQGYYAYDVGTWRVIALNSNISMAVNSPQYLWLKAELAANRTACTIAYWHAPRFFSAGLTIRNTVKPLWDLLYVAGAEVILNSDNRFYERFAPLNPDGAPDANFGIREFIVGTGGIGTSPPLATPREHSERLISPTFGILVLTLRDDGYDWEFRTTPGRALTEPETGSGTCHASPLPSARLGGPYHAEQTVAFDGRGSFDPQGDAPLRYEWDFGDGATQAGNQPADATPVHTYAADGVYPVSLTVVDPSGDRSEPATTTATIANIAPSVNAGIDLWANPNAQVTVRAIISDPGLEDGDWAYSIDWGDGSEPTTGEVAAQDEAVVGTHAYGAAGTYSVTVEVTDKDDGSGSDVVVVEVSDLAAPTQVLIGAGDIAQCDGARMSEKTATILKATPGTVFTLGDNAYPDGSVQQYRDCYGPGWGDPAIKSRTYAALGNHDYHTSDATPSFDYFGAALGPRGKGYYSYDLGSWHVIVLNNSEGQVPSDPGSVQFEWLKADLARSAATSRCTVVMAHQPYVYSPSTPDGDGIHPKNKPIWEELYKWGVELILAGDVHRYERFRPQSPEAEADDAYGIREFIVGTGGAGTSMPGSIRANSEMVSDAHGVLKLTLEPSRYTWEFVPVEGETFTDQGSGTCHDPKPTDPGNQAPVASDDQYAVAEDNALAVTGTNGVLGNDADADGDALSAALVDGSGPTHGTLLLNADGTFTYTPMLNFHGVDQFTYEASDGKGGVAVATVMITVTPVNDAPVAADNAYSTSEDAALTVPAAGVLANDSDEDGDGLSAVVVTGPTRGTLTLNADGSFSYTPNVNFNGGDTFTYKASDGGLQSAAASVSITVTPVNDAPVATADSYDAQEDRQLTVAAPGVLGNDTDVDAGQTLRAVVVTGPAHGTLVLNENGSFTYVPALHFSGGDTFTYRTTDGVASSGAVTVSISVKARTTVKLDMVPGSNTNSIGYSSSQTEVVFAITSSSSFNAALVDPATVTLGNDLGTDTPLARNPDGSFKFLLTDVNGDGRTDFYAYVNKAALKANGDLTLATKNMTVLGGLKTAGTDLFRGKDKVTVVP